MIITDRFVYIHLPKTGGSFVNAALLQAHGIDWNIWHHAVLTFSGRFEHQGELGTLRMQDKHGSCRRIPLEHQQKTIFSTIRHPLDYYVSDYEFGWWKRREWLKYYRRIPHFKRDYPHFPKLNFADYLRLMSAAFNPQGQQDFENPQHLGYFSASFLKMFARDPDGLFVKLAQGEEMPASALYPVKFIHTHALNKQLFKLLQTLGYPEASIRFILEKERVLPLGKGRETNQKWEQYYSAELLALLHQKDQLLFQLFPTYSTSDHP